MADAHLSFSNRLRRCLSQEDLKYLEASEDKNEEFYGGGGGGAAGGRPLEHFPQLWCPNGTYSAYGQVLARRAAAFGACPLQHMFCMHPDVSIRSSPTCALAAPSYCCSHLASVPCWCSSGQRERAWS